MRTPAPNQAARNAVIGADVANATRSLDREAQIRKQTFLLLDRIQKAHDFQELVRMNGERCASRQIYDLRVYDWLGKAAA